MVLRSGDGREFTFMGRDPTDPELCRWSVAGVRNVTRAVHALMSVDSTAGNDHRIGLRRLAPFAVGKETSYAYQSSEGRWNFTWRVIGEQALNVPAGRYDTWIVEKIEEGFSPNYFRGEQIFYVDKETGAVVKVVSRVVRGRANYSPSWEAVSFR
jgi:hypothetical protein